MKSYLRTFAAAALAAVLTFSIVPTAAAAPRSADDAPSHIVRIIKKIQKIFGITSQDILPVPPKP